MLTSGDASHHNRKIEIGINWASVAADVSTNVQPGGDIATHLVPGMKIGSDPLLIYNNYVSQTFVNGGNLPSGVDTNSVDVELIVGGSAPIALTSTIQSGHLVISWPAAVTATLQTSPVLGTGANWTNVGTSPTVVGYYNEVILPLSAASAFYRLVNINSGIQNIP